MAADYHVYYRVVNPGTASEKYEFEGWIGTAEWIDVFNEIMPNPSEWHDASELGVYSFDDARNHPKYEEFSDYMTVFYEPFGCFSIEAAMVRKVLPDWTYGDMGKDPERFFSTIDGDYDVVESLVPYQDIVNKLWDYSCNFGVGMSWDIYEQMTAIPDMGDVFDDKSFVDACISAGVDFKSLEDGYYRSDLTPLQSASSDVQSFILEAVANGYISLADACNQSDVWDIWMDSRDQGVPVEDIF